MRPFMLVLDGVIQRLRREAILYLAGLGREVHLERFGAEVLPMLHLFPQRSSMYMINEY
jgi:hypothetical protein